MKRMPVLLVLVVLTAGGSASAAPATKSPVLPELDVLAQNNPFPRQGLLVTQGQRTVFVGLDGRPYARLRGARPAWFASANSGRNAAFQELALILQDRRLFVGPRGRWSVFDRSGRLQPLGSPRIRLFGDIEVAARAVPTRDGVFKVDLSVEQAGRRVVPASAELRRISGNLAIGTSVAIDLRTGDRWHVAPDCYAAGTRDRELLMFCGPEGRKGSVALVAASTAGHRRTLARVPNSLYASGAYLSPNGEYVVAMFNPGCGASYGFVIPTDGGTARPLSGERRWSLEGPNSIALGWTTDNHIVAIVEPSRPIDADPKPGVYLVDPATLKRTLVYPSANAWAMWSS